MRKFLVWAVLATLLGTAARAERLPRAPILIRSDADFTAENGVVGGLGIFGDPYVISGVRIDAKGQDYGILILGTRRAVVIRDVEILGASFAGINIQSAKNVRIEQSWVRGCSTGISVSLGEGISVDQTRIEECPEGVRVLFSSGVELSRLVVAKANVGVRFLGARDSLLVGSAIRECDLGVSLEVRSEGNTVAQNAFLSCRIPARSEGGNAWDDGARGNYWEGFVAPDRNGDGILDISYRVGLDEDRFPLALPPPLP